ncbi:hypothetical protein HDU93_003545 [Gonapodya sp. JEL0774]|nr:hypothetical protein HDU93_003545 [Gonapodya sp. JEL0774]
MPLMGDPPGLSQWLRDGAPKVLGIDRGATAAATAISAILLVTAHWETPVPTFSSGDRHDLYFDYYGFPPETYNYTYPAPGSPSIAQKAAQLASSGGFLARLDDKRGWDHGVFVPMLLINPSAHIPIIQMSILSSLSAASHLALGRALAPLRDQGVAIVGSGLSFHNMRAFFGQSKQGTERKAASFDETLSKACTGLVGHEREKMLEGWSTWDGARESHPREEHLIPLMVVAGAAGTDEGVRVFADSIMGFSVSAFAFGGVGDGVEMQVEEVQDVRDEL